MDVKIIERRIIENGKIHVVIYSVNGNIMTNMFIDGIFISSEGIIERNQFSDTKELNESELIEFLKKNEIGSV